MLKVADPWPPFVGEAHQTASLKIPADVVTEQNEPICAYQPMAVELLPGARNGSVRVALDEGLITQHGEKRSTSGSLPNRVG